MRGSMSTIRSRRPRGEAPSQGRSPRRRGRRARVGHAGAAQARAGSLPARSSLDERSNLEDDGAALRLERERPLERRHRLDIRLEVEEADVRLLRRDEAWHVVGVVAEIDLETRIRGEGTDASEAGSGRVREDAVVDAGVDHRVEVASRRVHRARRVVLLIADDVLDEEGDAPAGRRRVLVERARDDLAEDDLIVHLVEERRLKRLEGEDESGFDELRSSWLFDRRKHDEGLWPQETVV